MDALLLKLCVWRDKKSEDLKQRNNYSIETLFKLSNKYDNVIIMDADYDKHMKISKGLIVKKEEILSNSIIP